MKGGAAMAAMKRVFIWLDDEREINKMWTDVADESVELILVRDADSCISALQDNIGNKIFISLDHDLGIGDTGYGVAKFIVAHSIEIAGFEPDSGTGEIHPSPLSRFCQDDGFLERLCNRAFFISGMYFALSTCRKAMPCCCHG